MKKTWKTIKSILNNDDKNTSFQEYFKDERDTIITDTKEIANRFNKFFTNIGSDLAKNIKAIAELKIIKPILTHQ